MFKLMIMNDKAKLLKFSPAPGIISVKVNEKYESKWLATAVASKLNKSGQFRKAGTVVVVPFY